MLPAEPLISEYYVSEDGGSPFERVISRRPRDFGPTTSGAGKQAGYGGYGIDAKL